MDINQKLQLEQQWHESEEFTRDDSSLIVGVYQSSVFREAEDYHLDALGDVAGLSVLDYGCGTGDTTAQLIARGARVAGFDISHTRLAGARQRVAAAGGGAIRPAWCSRLPRCCPLLMDPSMRCWASRSYTTWI